ncbi:MAG: hypothetical protein ACLP3K_00550 [Candidatus Acidiferrales bacterium]
MQIAGATAKSSLFWREFWILFGAGLTASAALAAISHLPMTPIAIFLFVKGSLEGPALVSIAVAETVIGLLLTVGLGLLAAHSIGLGAPILEKYLQRGSVVPYLRVAVIPTLLVGVLVGVWGIVPSLPIFHPNRRLIDRQVNELLNSPAETRIEKFVERTVGRRLTNVNLGPYYLSEAVSGELGSRLFLLSGVAWILAKASRAAPGTVPRTLLWVAIILTPLLAAAPSLAWHSVFQRLFSDAIGGIPLADDPLWLVATRLLVGSVPAGIGLGWLYVRRGLEAATIAAVIAGAASHLMTVLVLPRFY